MVSRTSSGRTKAPIPPLVVGAQDEASGKPALERRAPEPPAAACRRRAGCSGVERHLAGCRRVHGSSWIRGTIAWQLTFTIRHSGRLAYGFPPPRLFDQLMMKLAHCILQPPRPRRSTAASRSRFLNLPTIRRAHHHARNFSTPRPIDLQPESRRLRQAHHAIPDLGPTAIDRVVERMAARIAMQLRGERRVAERRDQMPVQMPHRMRRDQHALLFGIMRDPQQFGEPGMPRGIELHVADRAGVDEIAHRVAVPLPLAVRQRNRRRRGQALRNPPAADTNAAAPPARRCRRAPPPART